MCAMSTWTPLSPHSAQLNWITVNVADRLTADFRLCNAFSAAYSMPCSTGSSHVASQCLPRRKYCKITRCRQQLTFDFSADELSFVLHHFCVIRILCANS